MVTEEWTRPNMWSLPTSAAAANIVEDVNHLLPEVPETSPQVQVVAV